jgi:hypothetical protein
VEDGNPKLGGKTGWYYNWVGRRDLGRPKIGNKLGGGPILGLLDSPPPPKKNKDGRTINKGRMFKLGVLSKGTKLVIPQHKGSKLKLCVIKERYQINNTTKVVCSN